MKWKSVSDSLFSSEFCRKKGKQQSTANMASYEGNQISFSRQHVRATNACYWKPFLMVNSVAEFLINNISDS